MLAAPFAAGVLFQPAALLRSLCTVVAFTCASAAVYLINDVTGRAEDILHPVKRIRPIASGQLSVAAACDAAGVLAFIGCVIAWQVAPAAGALVLGYISLNLAYSLALHKVPVVDLVVVASGFVLRLLTGGLAVGVRTSSSLLLLTGSTALFVVAEKRHSDLVGLVGKGPSFDRTRRYTATSLKVACRLFAAAAILAHGAWSTDGGRGIGLAVVVSFILFALAVSRYRGITERGQWTAPEDVFLNDRLFQAILAAWGVVYGFGVYL